MSRFPLWAAVLAGLAGLLSSPVPLFSQESSPSQVRPFGAFAFEDSVHVALPPRETFDRFLEVDAWWDHRFSENPSRFYIDARPGGAPERNAARNGRLSGGERDGHAGIPDGKPP